MEFICSVLRFTYSIDKLQLHVEYEYLWSSHCETNLTLFWWSSRFHRITIAGHQLWPIKDFWVTLSAVSGGWVGPSQAVEPKSDNLAHGLSLNSRGVWGTIATSRWAVGPISLCFITPTLIPPNGKPYTPGHIWTITGLVRVKTSNSVWIWATCSVSNRDNTIDLHW